MAEPIDVDAFARRQLELLERERQAEIDEVTRAWDELSEAELERRGVTLRRLVVTDTDVGFGGRVVLTLGRGGGSELPAHRFATGDVVAVRAPGDAAPRAGGGSIDGLTTGVVTGLRRDHVRVALDGEDADEPELPARIRLDRIAPDVTFRRMAEAVRTLRARAGKNDDAAALRRVLLSARSPEFTTAGPPPTAVTPSLDASQQAAVAQALRAEHLALIHGPPGTGKTTTVVEVIRQAVARGDRVLATAPSNVAVDNLAERLAAAGLAIVRIGHPARMLPGAREFALHALVAEATDRRVVRELRRDLDAVDRQLARAERGERRALQRERRRLRADLRAHDEANVGLVLDRADVVLTTTTGAADRALRDARTFDLVVVDEAAQALEAACWIALHRGRRAVLAGDHRQLAPTILARDHATRSALAQTLFERLAESEHGDAITSMLTVQYRMHETIMRWSSQALYDGRLEAADSVRTHVLRDLPGVADEPDTRIPFVLLDTAGCGFEESADAHDGSKSNEREADLVATHVGKLLEAGVPRTALAVITPYVAQVQLLRERLGSDDAGDEIEIGTVDGFQGREKEAIVLSLVRSNDDGDVGFLADARRLNVAITRARRHVAIVGDSATLAHDAFLADLVDYAQEFGEHRSAWEYATG